VTFLDTADMYGVGHNEELVGKAMAIAAIKLCWQLSLVMCAAATAAFWGERQAGLCTLSL